MYQGNQGFKKYRGSDDYYDTLNCSECNQAKFRIISDKDKKIYLKRILYQERAQF